MGSDSPSCDCSAIPARTMRDGSAVPAPAGFVSKALQRRAFDTAYVCAFLLRAHPLAFLSACPRWLCAKGTPKESLWHRMCTRAHLSASVRQHLPAYTHGYARSLVPPLARVSARSRLGALAILVRPRSRMLSPAQARLSALSHTRPSHAAPCAVLCASRIYALAHYAPTHARGPERGAGLISGTKIISGRWKPFGERILC